MWKWCLLVIKGYFEIYRIQHLDHKNIWSVYFLKSCIMIWCIAAKELILLILRFYFSLYRRLLSLGNNYIIRMQDEVSLLISTRREYHNICWIKGDRKLKLIGLLNGGVVDSGYIYLGVRISDWHQIGRGSVPAWMNWMSGRSEELWCIETIWLWMTILTSENRIIRSSNVGRKANL